MWNKQNANYFNRCWVASMILSPESIVKSNDFDRAIPNTHISNENSLKYTIPDWYKSYREIFSLL